MNLYRLELMKIRLSVYKRAVLGILAGLSVMGILFLFIRQIEMAEGESVEEMALFASWSGMLSLMTALSYSCYCIFSAALAARVVVNEYCGKNAVLLLTYPVKRKAVLRVKCGLVCGITTAAALLGSLLSVSVMYAAAWIFRIMPQMDMKHFALSVLLSGLLTGLLSSVVGMISAALGWKKRSKMSVMICALLIVCVTANGITVSPQNIVWVLLGMSLLLGGIAGVVYRSLANGIKKMEV